MGLQICFPFLSILHPRLKLGYSGYNRLQGVSGIFSVIMVMGYITKLGYSGYKGLQAYFLLCSTS